MHSQTTSIESTDEILEHKYTLHHLPKYMNHTTLQKLLQKHFNLLKNEYKLKFRPKSTKAVILSKTPVREASFEYRNQTIKLLKDYNNTGMLEKAEKQIKSSERKKGSNTNKDIRDTVTPLWKLPYLETVKIKTLELRKLVRNKDIETHFIPTNNMLRNKFEFAFGFLKKENEQIGALGFRGSIFSQARNHVCCPLNVSFIPEKIKKIIENTNNLLNDPKYINLIHNRETNVGILKLYVVKYTEADTINLITFYETTEGNLENFCKSFLKHFEKVKTKTCQEKKRNEDHQFIEIFKELIHKEDMLENFLQQCLKEKDTQKDKTNIKDFINAVKFLINLKYMENLYFSLDPSTYEGIRTSKLYKISGKSSLTQKIFDFKFEISFFSFFQTNVDCFKDIITDIRTEIDLIPNRDVLLDLCCGSASIGILVSDKFRKVIGLEINKECFPDALANMLLNKINNYEYHIMDIKDIKQLNLPENFGFIAILDPPRAGVPKSVIKHIRENNYIKRLIFICCDYKKSKANLEDLCRPTSNEYRNSPFYIEKVKGYDMFPFTEKMEVIYHLFRN